MHIKKKAYKDIMRYIEILEDTNRCKKALEKVLDVIWDADITRGGKYRKVDLDEIISILVSNELKLDTIPGIYSMIPTKPIKLL